MYTDICNIDNHGRNVYHKVKEFGRFLKRGKMRVHEKCDILILESKLVFTL